MLIYYITDRKQFAGDERARRTRLLETIAAAARAGVDYIQLREKDLPVRDLEQLAGDALCAVRSVSKATKLLINSRMDVALAVGLDGVHLTSNDVAASEARVIEAAAVRGRGIQSREFIVGVSCHSLREVRLAESHGADFAVLAPIFEKVATGQRGVGVEMLRAAANAIPIDKRVEAGDRRGSIPVLALGGVTVENAAECLRAGAAGLAGIRLFQDGDVGETVKSLRESVWRAPSPAKVPPPRERVGRAPSPAKKYQFDYRRKLPHYQGRGRPIFITFRTKNRLELPPGARTAVLSHCLHDNGIRYQLLSAVVMPDHVHLVLNPLCDNSGKLYSIAEITQALKSASAHTINKLLSRSGAVWQQERFDHVLRSNEKLNEVLRYLLDNPVRRGLVDKTEEYEWHWLMPELRT